MGILCERFTTSKLRAYEELNTISTFGFRGEALASITYVARVRVTSRRPDSDVAYTASYQNSKMREPEPTQSAGNRGTTIVVDDLFYNLPVRKSSLRSSATEYTRIKEVVRRYAINYPTIAFNCRKDFGTAPDVMSTAKQSSKDQIRLLFGQTLGENLLEISSIANPGSAAVLSGCISGTDWSARKSCTAYFINGRLVDSSAIHKAVQQAYSNYLGKGKHPFVYLSLKVPPHEIDVNVHPTKAEVALLREDTVSSLVHDVLQEALSTAKETSKSFPTVTLKRPKLDYTESDQKGIVVDAEVIKGQSIDLTSTITRAERPGNKTSDSTPKATALEKLKRKSHNGLRSIFEKCRLVGAPTDSSILFESGDGIYVADLPRVVRAVSRQKLLENAACDYSITFSNPPRISDLCCAALSIPGVWSPGDGDQDAICGALVDCYSKHHQVLKLYGLSVSADGRILSLPRLWDSYCPPMANLPLVVLRIGSDIPWELGDSSPEVALAIATEMAGLYTPVTIPNLTCPEGDLLLKPSGLSDLLPALVNSLQTDFCPPPELASTGTVVQLTTVGTLCQTFERSHC
eukprot:TRINITY_DN14856_c0_g1_i1.p1 TRINITY_DN14856_c0_g1~~TRINITY_DN14856_c0_g1_i1.p1  ORF type:complete len:661 (+),score=87.86 TRINITY_DN14856_c0_g1_i1:260-1984(+)